jgi:hypothetical protein
MYSPAVFTIRFSFKRLTTKCSLDSQRSLYFDDEHTATDLLVVVHGNRFTLFTSLARA